MRKEILPRGIHRRNGSLVISFAYQGKVKYVSLGNCSVEFARDQLAITKMEIRKGSYVPKAAIVPTAALEPLPIIYTVKDLWNPYIVDYRNRGGKDEGRQTIAWNNLRPTFEAVPVSNVTTALISEYIATRQLKGIQNGTINRELAILQAMFRLGSRSTMANGQPMVERVPAFPSKLKEGKPRRGFLKDEQFAVLAANAKTPWLRAFIECDYKFGFRKSELLGLRKHQVDLIDGLIRLEDSKNGDPRTVVMTDRMRSLMLELVRGKGDQDYVFTREDGTRVVDPRQDWYDLCVAAKLGSYVPAKRQNGQTYNKYVGLNPHDFRRSALRNMTRRGVTEKIAMTISGHSTRSVFDRYNIVDETDLAEATRKIEARNQPSISTDESHTKLTHDNVRAS